MEVNMSKLICLKELNNKSIGFRLGDKTMDLMDFYCNVGNHSFNSSNYLFPSGGRI